MYKLNIPTSVQFELTYSCNNSCCFCYNNFSGAKRPEAPIEYMQRILSNIAQAGIFSVNFNGGEPLLRSDFFKLADFASRAGLDLHLNTNCTNVGAIEAKNLARFFSSVCTTILSSEFTIHDGLVGRRYAFSETVEGIKELQKNNIYVMVNLTICRENVADIVQTLSYLRSLDIRTLLITRIIEPPGEELGMQLSEDDLEQALRTVVSFQNEFMAFERIAFPQPFPPCKFTNDLRTELKTYNIPCSIGLNTARITPSGDLTPCTLVPKPLIGNLIDSSFEDIWGQFDGANFFKSCLPQSSCSACVDLDTCGGGCVGSNQLFQ